MDIKKELESIKGDSLVLSLIIFWILLTIYRFWAASIMVSEVKQSKSTMLTPLAIQEKILYLEFYTHGEDTSAMYDAIIKLYEKELKREINPHVVIDYVILLSLKGEKNKALAVFEKYKAHIKDDNIKKLIKKMYLSEEFNISKDEEPLLEKFAKKGLQGWFKDKTLLLIYEKSGNTEKKEVLLRYIKERKVPFIAIGATAISFLFVGGIFGFFLLIGLSIYSKIYGNKFSLAEKMKKGKEIFAVLTLKKAIVVFLIWDFARVLISLLVTGVFGGYKKFSPCYMFPTYLLLYGLVLYFILKAIKEGKTNLKPLGLSWEGVETFAKRIFLGFGVYLCAVPVIVIGVLIYQLIFKVPPQSSNPAFEIITASKGLINILSIYLIVGILAPIFEEILFRGFLYTTLRKYMPPVYSILIISSLFALVHFDIGGFFPLFLLGIVLATIYERTGSLIPSIVTHSLWNSMTFLLFVTLLNPH